MEHLQTGLDVDRGKWAICDGPKPGIPGESG
jgi:hypothetical protein